MKGIPNFFAATTSEPEPEKGTTRKFFSLFIVALINFSHKAKGFCVG